MNIILIGEAPPRRKRGVLDYEVFSGLRCERVNLLRRWPGHAGKGSLFPLRPAKRRALELRRSGALNDKLVICIGKRAAAALGLKQDYFLRVGNMITFPHPSGVNRWWNDARNRRRAEKFVEAMRCAS